MSLLIPSLMLAATQAAPTPTVEPASDHHIEVIASKLSKWSGSWKLRKGAVVCKIKRSTKDKQVDAIGCDAITGCITPIVPKINATVDGTTDQKEANRRVNALFEEERIGDCIFDKREAGIAALAAERRSRGK